MKHYVRTWRQKKKYEMKRQYEKPKSVKISFLQESRIME